MYLQGAAGGEPPDEPPLDDRIAHYRVRVQEVSLELNDQLAMRAETLSDSLVHLVIGKVNITAASSAHGRDCSLWHFELASALEAFNNTSLDVRLYWFDCRVQYFLKSKMLTACSAVCRVRRPRLRLQVPAVRTGHFQRFQSRFRHGMFQLEPASNSFQQAGNGGRL
jgi:hypothetical protein